jgi:hypothetical protein
MAEKQDIAMNAFKVLTDVTYLYGEDTDSSQGKIKKSDLYNIFLALIISNGGHLDDNKDFNEIVKFGLYSLSTKNNAPLSGSNRDWTVLVITNSLGDVLQIATEYAGASSGLYIRQRRSILSNSWTNWNSLIFTK